LVDRGQDTVGSKTCYPIGIFMIDDLYSRDKGQRLLPHAGTTA